MSVESVAPIADELWRELWSAFEGRTGGLGAADRLEVLEQITGAIVGKIQELEPDVAEYGGEVTGID